MMIGARTTMSTCRTMMRHDGRPETRAASTYSSPRTLATMPRTSRKKLGAARTPRMTMRAHTVGPSTAREASSTIIAGRAMSRLTTQPATASNHLPK
jgi:hypothetical protein